MNDVALERPTSELLLSLAQAVSAQPVDPPGVSDHSWLYGDVTQVLERLKESLNHCAGKGGGGWVILADRRAAGLVTVKLVDGGAETFSFVSREFQNRGLATAARAAVVALLQSDPRVQRVVSTGRAGSASARVSRKLDYALVGQEVRPHPEDGSDVVLERYELDLVQWSPPAGVELARFDPQAAPCDVC